MLLHAEIFTPYRRSGLPFATNNDPKALGEFGCENIREVWLYWIACQCTMHIKKPRTMPGLRCFLLEKR
jgi:hypothetical protein